MPIVAACRLRMPKTSSRAITSPAGPADTMETLAPVDLDVAAIRRVVERTGGCIVRGGSVRLSPADDILAMPPRRAGRCSSGWRARRSASTPKGGMGTGPRAELSWDKAPPLPCLSNACMSPHLPSLADPERTALLRLDAAYEQWRVADAALAESEIRLWTETLRGEDAETCRQTAAETLGLRDAARTARRKVLALLNPHGSSA